MCGPRPGSLGYPWRPFLDEGGFSVRKYPGVKVDEGLDFSPHVTVIETLAHPRSEIALQASSRLGEPSSKFDLLGPAELESHDHAFGTGPFDAAKT